MYAGMVVILSCGHNYVLMCHYITDTWETGSLLSYVTVVYLICVRSRVQMIPGSPGPFH